MLSEQCLIVRLIPNFLARTQSNHVQSKELDSLTANKYFPKQGGKTLLSKESRATYENIFKRHTIISCFYVSC